MGLFSKFKQVFKKEEKKQEDIEAFDKGLEKTRKEFVSELSILGHKYHKVNDDYFEEIPVTVGDILHIAHDGTISKGVFHHGTIC